MAAIDRDKLLDKRRIEREARIKESMSHREWVNRYTLKTENFAFEYTIDPDAMKGYADLMETYYKVFTKEWTIKKPPKAGRLTVCIYHDEDYYYQVTGMPYGAVGYFRFVEGLSPKTVAPPVTFTLTSFTPSGLSLEWTAPPGTRFVAEYTETLFPPNWQPYPDYITSTNSVVTFADDGTQTAPLGPTRYYRFFEVP